MSKLWQYQALAEPATITASERITPDKWAGSDAIPRAGVISVVAATVALAFVPLVTAQAASVAGWHGQNDRPVAAQTRAATTDAAQVPNTARERITPDKWEPERSTLPRQVSRAALLFPTEFRGDVPRREAVSLDRFHPQIEQVRCDAKRTQSSYPFEFRTDIARAERVSLDKFHPVIERPVFDVRRIQHSYPAEFRGDTPRREAVSLDRFHPLIEQVRFDVKRTQGAYPGEFRGDKPRAESVSLDRFHPIAERPVFDRQRIQFVYAVESRTDLVRLIRPDSWHPITEQPRFDARRRQFVYPAEARGDASRAESVSIDRFHPISERPVFDQPRRQFDYPTIAALGDVPRVERISADRWHTEVSQPGRRRDVGQYFDNSLLVIRQTPVFADEWHPASNQPVFDPVRNRIILPAEFRGDAPRIETVTLDRFHPVIEARFRAQPSREWFSVSIGQGTGFVFNPITPGRIAVFLSGKHVIVADAATWRLTLTETSASIVVSIVGGEA